MTCVVSVYAELFDRYGPQGWWPLLSLKRAGGSRGYYHPGDYSLPKTDAQRFEIAVGAVLTQNTAWTNVEKALLALERKNSLDPRKLSAMRSSALAALVRPSGYYNQKTRKLKELSSFWLELDSKVPCRGDLLSVWGVGPETADSVLLYAFHQPEFVVDAYTRRIGQSLGWLEADMSYDEVKAFFTRRLPHDFALYQEFHALLVEHAKRT